MEENKIINNFYKTSGNPKSARANNLVGLVYIFLLISGLIFYILMKTEIIEYNRHYFPFIVFMTFFMTIFSWIIISRLNKNGRKVIKNTISLISVCLSILSLFFLIALTFLPLYGNGDGF